MVQPITPSGAKACGSAEFRVSPSASPISHISSTLASGKQSKLKETFLKVWHFVTDFFYQVIETILYVISCGMSAPNRLEIVEEIIDDPERMGGKFAEKPKEMLSELLAACLIDPNAIKGLRDTNPDKVGEFIRVFKQKLPADKQSYVAGITSSDKTYLRQQLFSFLEGEQDLFIQTLEAVSPRVLAILGDQKENEKKEVTALRSLFKDYLPKVMNLRNEPTKLSVLHKEVLKAITTGKFNRNALAHISEINDKADIDNLVMCLNKNLYWLTALNYPQILGFPQDSAKLDFHKAFLSALIRNLTPHHIETMAESIAPEYSLLHGVLGELRRIVKSRSERNQMADQHQEAQKLIEQLNQDLLNPPSRAN